MKEMTIANIKLELKPITVQIDQPLDDLIDHFIAEPTMRHIYVVTEEGKLLGIIPRKKIFRHFFSEHLIQPSRISELYQTISANTASDLCNKNIKSLTLATPVAEAIQKMYNNELFELPVIDENTHPVATITAWDLLKFWTGQES